MCQSLDLEWLSFSVLDESVSKKAMMTDDIYDWQTKQYNVYKHMCNLSIKYNEGKSCSSFFGWIAKETYNRTMFILGFLFG